MRWSIRARGGIDMRRQTVRAVVIGLVAALAMAGTAAALVPANGGDAGGTLATINNGPGDQNDPHVSGDLAAYTEQDGLRGTSTIHYFNFITGFDNVVPAPAGDLDLLSDIDGTRIVFSRVQADGQTPVMVYDTVTGVETELDPQPVMARFGAVIGGGTVAYEDFIPGTSGDVYAYDLAAGTVTNLSHSNLGVDENPAVAPSGDVVVWEACAGIDCDVLQSVRTGGTWGPPTPVAATLLAHDRNPDIDGTTVVYEGSDPQPSTYTHIYLKPIAGGPADVLELPGFQRNPSISNGVVAFESKATLVSDSDIFLYVTATNMLFRVTATPTSDESLNDVSLLPNGDVRVVWAANDDVSNNHNVYARTFSLPAAVYAFDGFFAPVENPPVLNVVKGGQGIPVRFSLGGDQGLAIFESGYPKSQQVPCDPAAPVDGIEETVTAGASSLSYDATSDQYVYVWKTDKAWANTCRQLVLKLADGTYHRATFKFR
jgi:hypothetical protein